MCYTCSPLCDNCHPKFLVCPNCGHVCHLESKKCDACEWTFDETLGQEYTKKWEEGMRLGKRIRPHIAPMSRTNSPFR